LLSAGLGIGRIGGSAMDAIARQPEAGKFKQLCLSQLHLLNWFCSVIRSIKNNSCNGF
jgi:hypothetical protein